MTADRTLSAWIKTKRAEKHINDFSVARTAFLKSDAYHQIAYDEPETRDRVIKLRISANPPAHISAILGDAIHNLRSSLDHLARQMVEANGGTPNDDTAFPIFYDRKSFETKLAGKIRGASQDVLDLVSSLKPYKGGNDPLWALHRLDIIDKHRLLISVAARNPMMIPGGPSFPPLEGFTVDADGNRRINLLGALENGTELYRLKRIDRPENYYDPKFSFDIAFGDVLKGQPIVPTLNQFLEIVSRIVNKFGPLLV